MYHGFQDSSVLNETGKWYDETAGRLVDSSNTYEQQCPIHGVHHTQGHRGNYSGHVRFRLPKKNASEIFSNASLVQVERRTVQKVDG